LEVRTFGVCGDRGLLCNAEGVGRAGALREDPSADDLCPGARLAAGYVRDHGRLAYASTLHAAGWHLDAQRNLSDRGWRRGS